MPVIKPRTRGKHLVKHRTRLDQQNHETLYCLCALSRRVDRVRAEPIDRDRTGEGQGVCPLACAASAVACPTSNGSRSR
jgi:hypothetical protein